MIYALIAAASFMSPAEAAPGRDLSPFPGTYQLIKQVGTLEPYQNDCADVLTVTQLSPGNLRFQNTSKGFRWFDLTHIGEGTIATPDALGIFKSRATTRLSLDGRKITERRGILSLGGMSISARLTDDGMVIRYQGYDEILKCTYRK